MHDTAISIAAKTTYINKVPLCNKKRNFQTTEKRTAVSIAFLVMDEK